MLNSNSPSSPRRPTVVGTPTHVSEPAFEFLLHAMIEQIEIECHKEYSKKIQEMKKSLTEETEQKEGEGDEEEKKGTLNDDESKETVEHKDNATESISKIQQSNLSLLPLTQQQQQAEEEERKYKQQILMNENIAAKMERIGFDVGYRLVERLSQSKSLIPPSAHTKTPSQTQLQLEAVKFICKEFWTEIFRKQIDKLQTNHKGVFVLKDEKFKWLDRMPSDLTIARSMAIKILALPCGLIRGALSNLGIKAVVSCDFMDDGENMDSCSFNVKIK